MQYSISAFQNKTSVKVENLSSILLMSALSSAHVTKFKEIICEHKSFTKLDLEKKKFHLIFFNWQVNNQTSHFDSSSVPYLQLQWFKWHAKISEIAKNHPMKL